MTNYLDRKSLECRVVYSFLIGIAVCYFEVKAGFLIRGEYVSLAAYIPTIVTAFIVGAKLSSWYGPVEGEKPYTEILLIPLCIVACSVVVASLMFSFVSMVKGGAGPNFIIQYFVSAVSPAIVFIIGTWHILLVGGVASSIFLGGRNRCF